jgi:hypothetical protein
VEKGPQARPASNIGTGIDSDGTGNEVGTGLNNPSPPCVGTRVRSRLRSPPVQSNESGRNLWEATTYGGQLSGPDTFVEKGTAGGTGLGRWDGTSCFTEKSPEKSAPSPRPSPGGLGEGERWYGIGSGRDTSDGECVAERKTIADDDLLVVGIRARIRGKGSPPPAASPSGRSRSGSDIVPAGDGTHPLGRDQSHATVVARSRRHKTADPCPAPGSRASAPAGSAHLRNYSEALHRFRTAMSKNSDDKKDCPPAETFGSGDECRKG